MEIEYAKRDGKIIHDVETIKMDINKGLVKQVIFFEKNDGYSLEQNQLMIHYIKSYPPFKRVVCSEAISLCY